MQWINRHAKTQWSYPIKRQIHTEVQIYAETQTQYWHWPWSSSSLVVARGGGKKNKEQRRQTRGREGERGEKKRLSVRLFFLQSGTIQRLKATERLVRTRAGREKALSLSSHVKMCNRYHKVWLMKFERFNGTLCYVAKRRCCCA